MPGTKEIVRRIKSIKSTRKITRAMQMVSAAKMRKAQQATLASRSYSSLAWEIIRRISQGATIEHPLLEVHPDAKKIGVVMISTNRGLVGSFNSNLINLFVKEERAEAELLHEVIVLGKKAREALARLRKQLIAEFPKIDAVPPIEALYPVAQLLSERYATGQYKKIVIVYNHFVSTLVQKPTVATLLPLVAETAGESDASGEYVYEPDQNGLITALLPRIIESQLYQAVLESDASEHSARMVMMKNATEAAADLIDGLTLTYNQLRQNKITTELAEITAGKIALEDK